MGKKLIYFILLILPALAVSCASTKKIAYFQELEQTEVHRQIDEYQVRIMPNDNLYISVSALNMDAVQIFNTTGSNSYPSSLSSDMLNISGYLVDNDGYINYPAIGKVKLGGLTKAEATGLMTEKISEYIVDPTVNIRYLNYKVTVLGEVTRPGSYPIKDERVSILEALGMAGDLTIYGKRDNVLVCREINGTKFYERIDLTSPKVFESDYYYLQQNDIVYVQPNKARSGSSSYNQNLSIGISVISLIVTIIAILI